MPSKIGYCPNSFIRCTAEVNRLVINICEVQSKRCTSLTNDKCTGLPLNDGDREKTRWSVAYHTNPLHVASTNCKVWREIFHGDVRTQPGIAPTLRDQEESRFCYSSCLKKNLCLDTREIITTYKESKVSAYREFPCIDELPTAPCITQWCSPRDN